eukprot:GHVU01051401.1.p1 GENE.GHVU01051401.1~~GHVU01051401.1.p1  ORF type:complete len:292 (+),score=22.99 GHVU01051401.1:52-927(+)
MNNMASLAWMVTLIAIVLFNFSQCQKFQVKPADVATRLGASARFNCTISSSVVSSEDLEWWARGHPNGAADLRIMSTVYNHDPPPGYQIDKDEAQGRYDLIIPNVDIAKVATFECLLGASTDKKAATLTLTQPVECIRYPPDEQITDGEHVNLTCSVKYRGSRKPVLQWAHSATGDLDQDVSEKQGTDGYTMLRAVANLIVESDHQYSTARCELGFPSQGSGDTPPVYKDSCDVPINVDYSITQTDSSTPPASATTPSKSSTTGGSDTTFKSRRDVLGVALLVITMKFTAP